MYDSVIEVLYDKLGDTKDLNTKLNVLNGMFATEFTPNALSIDTPILGISLKQKRAQAGKAKTYLTNLAKTQNMEINLTPEEKDQTHNFYQAQINSVINNVLAPYLRRHSPYVVLADRADANMFNNVEDVSYLQPKYAAFKVLDYILSIDDIGIFRSIALSSMKISDDKTSPAFFKVTGNDQGRAHVEQQKFESVSVDGQVKLANIFNLNNKGMDVIIPLRFSSSAGMNEKVMDLQIRTQGGDQVAVEGKFI